MYIKLPESVPVTTAFAAGALILAGQVIEGTSIYLAGLCFVFLMLSVVAFNVAGGMVYPSGSYVAACALLTVELAIVVKVVLGEPMQRNLLVPEKTMLIYVVGMASMLCAAYVNSLVRPRRALLEGMVVKGNASRIAIACIVVSVGTPFILPKELVATFVQANYFLYLAVLIPVFDTVSRSNGTKSFSAAAFAAWAYSTFNGLLAFSKQGIFAASAAWVMAAVAAGYRISLKKLIILVCVGVVAAGILTPYSQIGRGYGGAFDFNSAVSISISLLSRPLELREQYENQSEERIRGEGYYHMFDRSEGLFDRLNMFAVDDALVGITDKGQPGNPDALWLNFVNIIPRYLYPDKPKFLWGNLYAQQLGILPPDDDTTGVSFSPFGDGYHSAQFAGVSIYAFGIFFFCFFVSDALAGNANRSIWALLFILYNLHAAPEGALSGPVYEGGQLSIFVIGLAIICSQVIPVLSNMIAAPVQQPMQQFGPDGKPTIGMARL
jgi:hypothetical protein